MRIALRPCLLILCALFSSHARGQEHVDTPNYEQANRFTSAYLRQRMYSTSVQPHWIGETDRFWYSYKTSAGTKYYLVDPEAGIRKPLFDHERMAAALSLALHQPIDAFQLNLGSAEINEEGTELEVRLNDKRFKITLATATVESITSEKASSESNDSGSERSSSRSWSTRSNTSKKKDPRAHRHFSPDRTAYVFAQEHNLYYVEASEEVKAEVAAIDARMKAEAKAKKTAEEAKEGNDDKDTGVDQKSGENEKVVEDSKETDNSDKETEQVGNQDTKLEKTQGEGGKTSQGDKSGKATVEKVRTGEDDQGEETTGEGHQDTGKDSEQVSDDSTQVEKLDTQTGDENQEEGGKDSDKDSKGEGSKSGGKSGGKSDGKSDDKSDDKSGGDSNEDSDEKPKDDKPKVDEREAWADAIDESKALQLTTDGEEKYEFYSGSRYRRGSFQLEEGQEAYLDILQTGEFTDALPGDGDKDKQDSKTKETRDDKDSQTKVNESDGEKDSETDQDKDEEEGPEKSRPSVNWSQDSTSFYATRRDSRDIEELFLVNSLSTPRPTLESYSYPMPGEKNVARSELFVFDRNRKSLFKIEGKWKDEGYRNIHWGKVVTREKDDRASADKQGESDSSRAAEEEELDLSGTGDTLRFQRRDRLVRSVELCSIDVRTGKVTTLIEENFERANIAPQSVRYLKDRDELLWWSERSGWGHFYLYSKDGEFKNAVTSGPFRASKIVEVDEDKGLLYFRGNARENGENVYYEHLYRVFLDGSGLTLMDPGDANHRSILSPSKKYVVDNCSRVDMAPLSRLCDAEGKEILTLEESDLSRLYAAGWKMPETFTFKAADGVTDLYGNLWKPFDFDAAKKYAIIAEVYPGPQMEGVSHSFSASHGRQQLAQLGFLVVQLGHRGGTPGRSKAYHSYGYFNLRDYGLADKKAGIEQLAEQRPYVDINRVGIYGHSGGGFMTAAALMLKPYNDFFKVGVSSSGNHDNNVYGYYWAERYHGMKEVPVENKKAKNSRAKEVSNAKPRDGDEEKTTKVTTRKDDKTDQVRDGEGKKTKEETTQETRFEIKVPSNAELAEGLKGHLLLTHGDMDNNVHPAGTLRLVDALIRANKRFDLLMFPGKRHGYGDASGYFTQRKWDYFVLHLMGHRPTNADILDKD